QRVSSTHVVAVTSDFGTATLLSVRDTFKSPLYVGLYTIFVLAACFHAFNGFWTFLITWGVVLRVCAQKGALKLAWAFMTLVAFFGLAAIWGTYFLNLKT
ncbi:MAG: succinate dehydrogenase, partial [Rhabdochlamydiaceae bacterium]